MPEWIHERAKHISAKNPSMPESEAWAIATQQAHATGKSPKGYGTLVGRREAKQKYDTPKDDKKTANPGDLDSKKVAGVGRFPYRVIIETTRQGSTDLPKLLKAMQGLGGPGHSFGVVSDDSPPVRLGGWDGDGGMAIGQIQVHGDVDALREEEESRRRLREKSEALAEKWRKEDEAEKVAGIAVQYDMNGNPKHAETSDEWLAAHFKSTGSFMIPNRLSDAQVDFLQSKCAEARRDGFLNELGLMAVREMMGKEAYDPRITHALVGAGLGAGLGGTAGYVGTKALEPMDAPEEDSHAGRNAAIGALLGGTAGAGLGFMSGRQLHDLRQRADAAGKEYVANAGAGKFLPEWEPPPRPRPVVRDFTPIPLGEATDNGMARLDEVQGAQQALQQAMAPGRADLPGTNDPDRIYGAIQRIQNLEPLSVRARAGANPGYLARKGIAARRGIATKFNLGPEETEMALRGKFGSVITPEEAEASLARYQKLQDQKPTVGQVGRYAALGATAAPVAGVLKNVITGGGASWSGVKDKALEAASGGWQRAGLHGRALAGMAAAGALTSGAIPLIRAHLDQQAEKAKLKSFLQQQAQPHLPDGDGGELKTSAVGPEGGFSQSEYSTPIEGPKRVRQASYIPPGHKTAGVGAEAGFSPSGYGDTGGFVDFHQVSGQGAPPVQDLRDKPFAAPAGGRVGAGAIMIPTVKTSGAQGQLRASSLIGKTPNALGDVNSIASVAKPKGFGQVAVGAKQPAH